MSLSDCSMCWDTPCTCGHEYKEYSKDYFVKFILKIVSKNPYKKEIIKEVYEQFNADSVLGHRND